MDISPVLAAVTMAANAADDVIPMTNHWLGILFKHSLIKNGQRLLVKSYLA